MYRDPTEASDVELSAPLAWTFPLRGFHLLFVCTVALLLAAVHDAVLFGLAWRNLLLLPVPYVAFWAWRLRNMLGGPRVFAVPEGIEIRHAHTTRRVRLANAISVRRFGPRALQLAYFEWSGPRPSHHRLYFACRADLPEDALAAHARLNALLTDPPQLASQATGDAADPHGTRAFLLALSPEGAKYLDAGGGRHPIWIWFAILVVMWTSQVLARSSMWFAPMVVVVSAALYLTASEAEALRTGDPFIEPTSDGLVFHRPTRRVLPWTEVLTAQVVGTTLTLVVGARWWRRGFVMRALAPAAQQRALHRGTRSAPT